MRIAFLTEYTKIGGGEKNLFYLAKELSKIIDATVFCPLGDFSELLNKNQIKHVELKGYMGARWFKMLPLLSYKSDLYKKLKNFDIIHCYSVNVIAEVLLLKGVKKVWTVHGFWEKPYGLKAKIINHFFDKIIAVSNDVKSICKFPEKKIQTIFLGVPVPILLDEEKKLTAKKKIIIASIGRFQHIKGQDLLLKALKLLQKNNFNLDIVLNFVGELNSTSKADSIYYDSILNLSNSIKTSNLEINFKGFQKNVFSFIQEASFVVVPSRYESFSIVTVEALMQGKPVLAPFIGGLKDLLKSEKLGVLFKPNSEESLAQGLLEIIRKSDSFDSKYIRDYAHAFSIQKQAESHILMYQALKT